MFIVQVVGAVKGMESGEDMRIEIQERVEKVLEDNFEPFGLWEIFVKEEKTPHPIR
jgi:hypothetical protein